MAWNKLGIFFTNSQKKKKCQGEKHKPIKTWRRRGWLINDLNSLSLQKKNNCEMLNRIIPLLCSLFVFFFFFFKSRFIPSPCLKSEPSPSFWDCRCFSPSTGAFLPSEGKEEQSQERSSWILSCDPAGAAPKPLPLAALHLLYFPFSSSPTRPDPHLPWNILAQFQPSSHWENTPGS